jgi:hypothetical protein
MFVAPGAELVVDDLIGVYQGPRRYHRAQDGLNGLALNIGEHENGYIAGLFPGSEASLSQGFRVPVRL